MPRVFTCEVCNKDFEIQSQLNRHMRTHTGERPYGCDVCGKKFLQKHHLSEHVRSHSNTRPFSCSTCGKAFAQSSTLKNHMQSHNPRSESPHVCPNCGKTFTRSSGLRKHTKTAHSLPITDVAIESHEEPVGTVTTTTHSFSTDSSTTRVSYVQSPNTGRNKPVQVVTQSIGTIETTMVTQSSETISHSQSFDDFQEELASTLPDLP